MVSIHMFGFGKRKQCNSHFGKTVADNDLNLSEGVLKLARDFGVSASRLDELMKGSTPREPNEAGVLIELQRKGLA